MPPRTDDIENRIRAFFDDDFETLKLESGHSLSPDVKQAALQQVLIYWRKLQDIATQVTDTEVKLNLPEQTTPGKRKFGIEGIVDIVRENDRVVMYDIKTHDVESVEANRDGYEKQLNVYAYIWQGLRGERLDETAVICTAFSSAIREALNKGDDNALQTELDKWHPVIDIPYDAQRVQATIDDFAAIVDCIEDHQFAPAPPAKLKTKLPASNTIFAVNVCRNCDARFSCSSYRAYATTARGAAERTFRAYFADTETDTERDDRVIASLDVAPALTPFDDLS